MKVLVVPADPEQPIRRENVPPNDDGSTLDGLQALVGGWIESVPVFGREHDLSLFINEEGKFNCLDDDGNVIVNVRVTEWLRDGKPEVMFAGKNLFTGDFIAGDVIFVGFNPKTGASRDCPADVLGLAEL